MLFRSCLVYYVAVWEWVGKGKWIHVSSLPYMNQSQVSASMLTAAVAAAPVYPILVFVIDVCRQYTRLSFWGNSRSSTSQTAASSAGTQAGAANSDHPAGLFVARCSVKEFLDQQDTQARVFSAWWDIVFLLIKAVGSICLFLLSYESWEDGG